jgi:pimeloyl-ACP methyl ester carboxylesterase
VRLRKILIDALIRGAYSCAAMVALAAAFAGAAAASEVTLPHGAVTLRATLDLARGRTVADGVVLMVHGTMGHRDMEVMRHFRQLLGEKGYSTLAINLSLGLDRREGMYDCALPSRHRAEDALAEIGAWMDWAARQGARRVTLLGFSRGAQQAAWYAAGRPHASLARLVLLVPIFPSDFAGRYAARFGKPLAPLLDQARSAQPRTLLRGIGFLNCDDTAASAEAVLSYYAAPPASELAATLRRVGVPTLVVVAGADQIVVDLDKRIAPLVDGRRVRMTLVPGADHFLRDLYGEDAADAIHDFLRQD